MYRVFCVLAAVFALVATVGPAPACDVAVGQGLVSYAPAPTCGQASYAPAPVVTYAPATVYYQPAPVFIQREIRFREVRDVHHAHRQQDNRRFSDLRPNRDVRVEKTTTTVRTKVR